MQGLCTSLPSRNVAHSLSVSHHPLLASLSAPAASHPRLLCCGRVSAWCASHTTAYPLPRRLAVTEFFACYVNLVHCRGQHDEFSTCDSAAPLAQQFAGMQFSAYPGSNIRTACSIAHVAAPAHLQPQVQPASPLSAPTSSSPSLAPGHWRVCCSHYTATSLIDSRLLSLNRSTSPLRYLLYPFHRRTCETRDIEILRTPSPQNYTLGERHFERCVIYCSSRRPEKNLKAFVHRYSPPSRGRCHHTVGS